MVFGYCRAELWVGLPVFRIFLTSVELLGFGVCYFGLVFVVRVLRYAVY